MGRPFPCAKVQRRAAASSGGSFSGSSSACRVWRLRFGELAGLRCSRIDVARGRVIFVETLIEANGKIVIGPPKTRRSHRAVPLPRRVVAELQMHHDNYVAEALDSLVFTGPKGAPLRRAGFRRSWWRRATEAPGLSDLKFHELRHTFVALWIAAGADPNEVSVRAGHSSVAFTLDRYGHLYEDAEDQIPDRLDALLFSPDAHQALTGEVVAMRRKGRGVL